MKFLLADGELLSHDRSPFEFHSNRQSRSSRREGWRRKKKKKENEHNADTRVRSPKIAGRIRAIRWMNERGRGEGAIDPDDLNNSADVSHLQEMAARSQSEMRFEGATYVARMPRSGVKRRSISGRWRRDWAKSTPFASQAMHRRTHTHTHTRTDAQTRVYMHGSS